MKMLKRKLEEGEYENSKRQKNNPHVFDDIDTLVFGEILPFFKNKLEHVLSKIQNMCESNIDSSREQVIIKKIIQQADPYNMYTILFAIHIIKEKYFDMVIELLKKLNLINKKILDNLPVSAISYAILKNKPHVIRTLVKNGASIDSTNKVINNQLLMGYVVQNSTREMILELTNNNIMTNVIDDNGDPLLHVAILQNREDIIKILLNKQENVNSFNTKTGINALTLSIIKNRPRITELLLTYEANPYLCINFNNTIMCTITDLIKKRMPMNIVEYLLVTKKPITIHDKMVLDFALKESIEQSTHDISKLLLKYNANVNSRINGITILTKAIFNGNIELVNYLIKELRADPNTPSYDENTYGLPLSIAINKGFWGIVNYLVIHGANPYYSEMKIESPLIVSLLSDQKNKKNTIRYLLNHKAQNTNEVNQLNRALSIAIEKEDYHELIPLLLKKGANINFVDQNGVSLLIKAIILNKNPLLIQQLLMLGADPNHSLPFPFSDLRTPLHFSLHNPIYVSLLLEYNANSNEPMGQNHSQYSILHAVANNAIKDENHAIVVSNILLKTNPNLLNNNKHPMNLSPLHIALGNKAFKFAHFLKSPFN